MGCATAYEYGFGLSPSDPLKIDLTEPVELRQLQAEGVSMVNLTPWQPLLQPAYSTPCHFSSPAMAISLRKIL
ncbi:MAG: hypothetical protein R3C56_02640 [Pirellulaceae bacterium]